MEAAARRETAPGRSPRSPRLSPRPARICASRPPNEWPMRAGFFLSPRMISSKWSATCPIGLVREHVGLRVRLIDGLGVVGPARDERGVAGLFEDRRPAVPTAGQQPEAVDEDGGLPSRRVCALHLLRFILDDRRHEPSSCAAQIAAAADDIRLCPPASPRSFTMAAGRCSVSPPCARTRVSEKLDECVRGLFGPFLKHPVPGTA